MDVVIDGREIGLDHPTFFIADIAANHDGSLDRARALIRLAAEAGADVAKFQHFKAEKIVSDHGFSQIGSLSHQATWKRPVTEVYASASVPTDWTPQLKAECDANGIIFMSSPYDFQSVDDLDPYVPAYKIGSGDIDWFEELEYVAKKGKPVILATGAADIGDVQRAVTTIERHGVDVIILQCNTSYTAADENYDHLHLNVLRTYAAMWPGRVLGLSDHMASSAPVVAAVALGARVIERHFTDDNGREGPDHRFALNPAAWRAMVDDVRIAERALGSSRKLIADNEQATAVIQRRCVRAARDIAAGHVLTRDDLDVLRPATPGGISPSDITDVIGLTARSPIAAGSELRWTDLCP